MRVAVLMGGKSSEREISLRSGKAVVHALLKKGMEVTPLDIADDNLEEVVVKKNIDVAFIALHGKYGEDGTVQSLLEKLNIPYTGSGVEASRVAFDKVCAKEIFLKENIPTPDFYILEEAGNRVGERHIDMPLVVKPAREGSAIGVSIVREEKEFQPALEEAIRYDSKVLVERYVKGKEITVGILNGTALPVIEVRSRRDFFDFEAKYDACLHEFIIPAPLEEEIYHGVQEISLQSHNVLKCSGFSRVDLILSGGEPYVLEVNTIPGLTDVSLFPAAARAAGIDFPELCQKIIEIALRQ